MNSLGDKSVHTAAPSSPVIKTYMYACIINIYVPHEIQNQRPLAKRTSEIMKYGQDVAIQKGHM